MEKMDRMHQAAWIPPVSRDGILNLLKHGQGGTLISGNGRRESGREERADGLQ